MPSRSSLASDQGRRGVLVTLIGDVASNYFLLRELDLQLDIARRTLNLNDETVDVFPEPTGWRCLESARGGSDHRSSGR